MPPISSDTLQQRGLRPVWLASYPRSGNTFLRILLEQIFRLPTYSRYYVEGESFHDVSADPLEEAPRLPANWRELIRDRPEAETILVKTHDHPEDAAPAIYIVREGGPTIHSYYHYHQTFGREKLELTAVIAGVCQFGSWSDHYLAWQPHTRPQTLFLRYEDLVGKPHEVIPQLAKFLEREPLGGKLPTFEELNAKYPRFFRRGQNTDFRSEWRPGQVGLFNLLHGAAMKQLGYPLTEAGLPGPEELKELTEIASKFHRHYWEQLHQAHVSAERFNRDFERAWQQYGELKKQYDELWQCRDKLDADYTAVRRCVWYKLGRIAGLVPHPTKRASSS